MYLISLLRIFRKGLGWGREPKSTKIHTDITLEVCRFLHNNEPFCRVGSRQFLLFFRDIYIRVGLDWGVRRYANIFFKLECCVRGVHERVAHAPAPCARAAGRRCALIYYVEIFATDSKHLDTSLLIFQMQISRSVVKNIISIIYYFLNTYYSIMVLL